MSGWHVLSDALGALTPLVLQEMELEVAALVDGLLDGLERRGRFDLIEDFAATIPVEVIGKVG